MNRKPNNTGTVTTLSGNRTSPYGARITIGYDEETGEQIQKYISYHETWEQANDALTIYFLNQKKIITEQEVQDLSPKTYDKLIQEREKNIPTFYETFYFLMEDPDIIKKAKPTKRGYKTSFNHFSDIFDRKMNNIHLKLYQDIFDEKKEIYGSGTTKHMKVLLGKMVSFCIKNNWLKKEDDYVSYINASTSEKAISKTIPFSYKEIKKLYTDNTRESKKILCYIFTGARPIELCDMPKENVFIQVLNDDNGEKRRVSYMIGGVKTSAGKNRIFPISPIIEPFIIEFLEEGHKYLFSSNKPSTEYNIFLDEEFHPLLKRLGIKDRVPYSTRHTFATQSQSANLSHYARKRILGHADGLTNDTYTATLINDLYNEILKLKIGL